MSDRHDARGAETPMQVTQGGPMTDKKVWFVNGAGREMGVTITKAALAARDAVTATSITKEEHP